MQGYSGETNLLNVGSESPAYGLLNPEARDPMQNELKPRRKYRRAVWLGATAASIMVFMSRRNAAGVGRLSELQSTALQIKVSNAYERREGHELGEGLYPFSHLVEVHTPTRIEVC